MIALKPFDVFGLGVTSWREYGVGEEVEDRLRSFAEEADAVQGFQVHFDLRVVSILTCGVGKQVNKLPFVISSLIRSPQEVRPSSPKMEA